MATAPPMASGLSPTATMAPAGVAPFGPHPMRARSASNPSITPILSSSSSSSSSSATDSTGDSSAMPALAPVSSSGGGASSTPAGGGMLHSHNIRVVVRLRPYNEREAATRGQDGDFLRVDTTGTTVLIPQQQLLAQQQQLLAQQQQPQPLTAEQWQAPRQFNFDAVLPESTSQAEAFVQAARPVVDACLAGFHGTILAYGQTGSGKTFTMTGPSVEALVRPGTAAAAAAAASEDRGVIPRVLEYLFERLHALAAAPDAPSSPSSSLSSASLAPSPSPAPSPTPTPAVQREFDCRCSFLEIYNERMMDLAAVPSSSSPVFPNSLLSTPASTLPSSTAADSASSSSSSSSSSAFSDPASEPPEELTLRLARSGEVFVEGLTEHVVTGPADALAILAAGLARRRVGCTAMNRSSSRSHTVFTLTVTLRETSAAGTVARTSRLNLVDLAGSECVKATGTTGLALKEAANINRSLSALGSVIMALVSRQPHVPYRNSKLTFLLKESFGGNSKTCLVANVAPSSRCMAETISTLTFAARARKLPNKAVVAMAVVEGAGAGVGTGAGAGVGTGSGALTVDDAGATLRALGGPAACEALLAEMLSQLRTRMARERRAQEQLVLLRQRLGAGAPSLALPSAPSLSFSLPPAPAGLQLRLEDGGAAVQGPGKREDEGRLSGGSVGGNESLGSPLFSPSAPSPVTAGAAVTAVTAVTAVPPASTATGVTGCTGVTASALGTMSSRPLLQPLSLAQQQLVTHHSLPLVQPPLSPFLDSPLPRSSPSKPGLLKPAGRAVLPPPATAWAQDAGQENTPFAARASIVHGALLQGAVRFPHGSAARAAPSLGPDSGLEEQDGGVESDWVHRELDVSTVDIAILE